MKPTHEEPTHRFLAQPSSERGEYDDIVPEDTVHAHPTPKAVAPVASAHPLPKGKPSPVIHSVSTSTTVRSRYMDTATPSKPIRKPAAPLTKGTISSSHSTEKKAFLSTVSGTSASNRTFSRPARPVMTSTVRGSQPQQVPQASQTSQTSQTLQTPKVASAPAKPASSTIPNYMRDTKASAIRASMAKPVTRTNVPSSSCPRRPIVLECCLCVMTRWVLL